jgi:hypothetical protein
MEHKKPNSAPSSKPNSRVMQMANEIRAKSNRMTDDQRMAAFDHGMKLIYGGGNHGVAAKVGRA